MTISIEEVEQLLVVRSEDEHLEFKEAKNHFDFEELVDYCVALANEGGGPNGSWSDRFFAEASRRYAGV